MKKWVETFVGCACPGLKLNDVDVSFTREYRELKSEPDRLVAELMGSNQRMGKTSYRANDREVRCKRRPSYLREIGKTL